MFSLRSLENGVGGTSTLLRQTEGDGQNLVQRVLRLFFLRRQIRQLV